MLIAEHSSEADAGRLLPALESAGCRVETVRTHTGQLPPRTLDGYQGFVALGGGMFVSDADRYPFIGREQRLFREAIVSETPALGICLGGQILASALGARLYRESPIRLGWDAVRFDAAGDPLMSALSPESVLFEWHHESFELPPSAVLLGGSDAVPTQAFRAGSAWGIQFHLEVEARHVLEWSNSAGGREDLEALEVPPPADDELFPQRLERQISLADEVFGAFARLVAGTHR